MTNTQTMNDIRHIQLGEFIRGRMPLIMEEWSSFARTCTPASDTMTAHDLQDHIVELLTFIADDLESAQTNAEQVLKSQGEGPREKGVRHTAAETHAALRLRDGFDIDQMVAEYRALRASVTKLWAAEKGIFTRHDLYDLVRFNEAVDQSVTESISHYTYLLNRSRDLFLGILGHDLRNPVGAASMLADQMVRNGGLDAKSRSVVSDIKDCTLRATLIIEDLLDLTRLQIGSKLPLSRSSTDIAALSEQLLVEMRALHPGRTVDLKTTGDMHVEWDRSRFGQVLSNLVGNAMEHGSNAAPVTVDIAGETDQITVSVRNKGRPIEQDEIKDVFDLFKKGIAESGEDDTCSHLGLGLHITKEIVIAHGGTISVTSDNENGTNFTAVIPRRLDVIKQ